MENKMKKNKIWLLKVGEALPSDEGEQRLLRMGLIAEELSKDNNYVTWWVSSFDHNKKEFRKIDKKELPINDNLKLIFLKGKGYKKNWSIARLRHYLQEKKEFFKIASKMDLPDIILASMPNMDLANAAVKFGKKHDIPVVIDVRDTWPELYVDYAPNKLKPIVNKMIFPFKRQLSWTLSNAYCIFATSDKFLDWALTYAKRPRNKYDDYFYVSYPDTNIKLSKSDINSWYRYDIDKDDIIVCFFGQFGHAVDIETVIRASNITYKVQPNIKYVICGTGEKLNVYRNMIEKNNKCVIFPGWVNRKQICALGKISTFGLLSYVPNKNFENSMPNKFCEYLALSQILLIQPKGMMKDFALKNNCGYCYENDQQLAKILIETSKKDIKDLNEMKKNSRLLYENAFKSDIVYKRLSDKLLYIANEYKKRREL